jgi:hypothetical protein
MNEKDCMPIRAGILKSWAATRASLLWQSLLEQVCFQNAGCIE